MSEIIFLTAVNMCDLVHNVETIVYHSIPSRSHISEKDFQVLLVTGKCNVQSPYYTLGKAETTSKMPFQKMTVYIQQQRSVYYLVVDNNAGVRSMCHRIIYASLIQLWISV